MRLVKMRASWPEHLRLIKKKLSAKLPTAKVQTIINNNKAVFVIVVTVIF